METRRKCNAQFLAAVLSVFVASGWAAPGFVRETARIRAIVTEFKSLLGITEFIDVTIAENEPLLFSVFPHPDRNGAFRLKVDPYFLETLSEEEARAAVAHEMGHVWIFTHHPHVQTEPRANQIAERIVPRASLERLYEKVWLYQEIEGEFSSVLERGSGLRNSTSGPADPSVENEQQPSR